MRKLHTTSSLLPIVLAITDSTMNLCTNRSHRQVANGHWLRSQETIPLLVPLSRVLDIRLVGNEGDGLAVWIPALVHVWMPQAPERA